MSLLYARIRLAEWGKYSRDSSLGFPGCSAFISNGRGSQNLGELPTHVALIDVIVRQLEMDLRRVLIVTYTQTGTRNDKALRIGIPQRTFERRLKEGQHAVSIELDYAESCEVAGKMA